MRVKKRGKILWAVLLLAAAGAGCAVDQRRVVVRQEAVASQNDTDWKIIKQPQRPTQAGQR